jgi:hypothetical protein
MLYRNDKFDKGNDELEMRKPKTPDTTNPGVSPGFIMLA